MRVPSAFLFLVLVGCADDPSASLELLVPIDTSEDALSLEVASAQGVGVVEVPVRLVNTYGMSVPGGSVTVSTTAGELPAPDIEFDAFGYAEARVSAESPTGFTLSTIASTDGATPGASGWSAITSTSPPNIPIEHATFLPVNGEPRLFAGAAFDGVTVAVGDEIWWAPYTTGIPAHRVADLGAPVSGMVRAEIDADGVPDLLAWSGPNVFMLRGRAEGGYAWGAGWRSLNGDIVGASAVDLDADRITDIAIAASTDSTGYLGILWGNGAWGFEQSEVAELTYPVASLSAADESFNGTPDVTVVNLASGSLRRYTLLDDGWVGGSTPEITAYDAGQGTQLLPQADLDADGVDELLLVGPPGASSQDLVFFSMGTTVTMFPQTYGQFYPAVGELNAQPGAELVALEDDLLHVTWWDADRGTYVTRNTQEVGLAGPLALRDFDEDGYGDFAISATHVSYHYGGEDGEGRYTESGTDWSDFNVGLEGPFLLLDDNDDGVGDLLGFIFDGDEISMGLWQSTTTDTGNLGFVLSGLLTLEAGVEAHAMVSCDDTIFALYGSGDTSILRQIEIRGATDSRGPRSISKADVTGSLLDCGTLSDGEPGAVVASTSGAWTTYNTSLEVESTGDVGSTGDIAIVETSSGPEVIGCLGSDCSVATPDVDGDGEDEILTYEEVMRLSVGGAEAELAGSGILRAEDVDGDGYEDVVATDLSTGHVALYRGVSGGLAPPLTWQISAGLAQEVQFFDADDDGTVNLWWADVDGAYHVSPSAGGEEPPE